jgi:LSD1 subclass zinc finger protein
MAFLVCPPAYCPAPIPSTLINCAQCRRPMHLTPASRQSAEECSLTAICIACAAPLMRNGAMILLTQAMIDEAKKALNLPKT